MKCSTVLPENLTGFRLVKKFLSFYRTRSFTTTVTSARHLSLSWARSIQSILPHPTSWLPILLLSPHLRSGLLSGLFPSGFPTKTLYIHLIHTRYMPSPSYSSLFDHPNNIWWAVQIIKLLIIQFSPFPSYLVPLRHKYSPQHPILKHPQPKFLPQFEPPSVAVPITIRNHLQ